jgi:site-specific DNA recombinase
MSKESALGIDRQVQLCRALADQKGWIVEAEFIDNDVSASTGKRRPAYEAMLTAIRQRQINAVLVYDLDRLTRRPIEIEDFITLADEYQLSLGSVGGDVDLSTDNGRMFARIKGAVARAEVERKSARQKAANKQAREAGHPPTRRAFGYPGVDQRPGMKGRGIPVPVEWVAAEAQAVRDLYAGALAGDTLITLAKKLGQAGHTTTRGGRFDRNTVRSLLLNPRYAGLRAFEGTVEREGNWEPIVERETWEAVRAGLLADERRTNHRLSTARLHLLAGLALCGTCADGTTMKTGFGGSHAGRTAYRVYTCRQFKHLSRRADYIDEYVTHVMLGWAGSEQAAQFLARETGPDMAGMRQEAATLNLRLDQLAESYADGKVSMQQLTIASDRMRRRLADIEQTIQAALSRSTLGPLVGPDAAARWEAMNLDRRRQAINLAFTVTLLPRGTGGRPVSSRFDPGLVAVDPR